MGPVTTAAALATLLSGPVGAVLSDTSFSCPTGASYDDERTERYDDLILKHAQARRLNPRLVKAIIAAESQFAPTARSPHGARGLMQVLPSTAREMGVPPRDLADPDANIRAGTKYLARLFSASRRRRARAGGSGASARSLRRVIAAYHDGPRVLWSDADAWPASTRRYVRVVMSCYGSDTSTLRGRGAPAY